MENQLGYYRFSKNATAPLRVTSQSAGFDLSSAYDVVVPKRDRAIVITDLALKIPKNCYGRIASRSGLALRHGILVGAGVVDSDYTGNIKVILFNHSDTDYYIKQGDRIAQIICEQILYPQVYEISTNVEYTERNSAGFGSSGV